MITLMYMSGLPNMALDNQPSQANSLDISELQSVQILTDKAIEDHKEAKFCLLLPGLRLNLEEKYAVDPGQKTSS